MSDLRFIALDGRALRVRRESLSLSQAQLAAQVGVSRSTIAGAESGRPLRVLTVSNIARFFDVPVESILGKPSQQSPGGAIRALSVFLCHSSEDKAAVRSLYERLVADGVDPWLDEKKLLPGQAWEAEITEAVRVSDAVLVCLSRVSATKSGFSQKEIRFALDVADEKPEGTIFIVPVRLEDCDVPARLKKWHWVDLFSSEGYSQLLAALRERAASLGKPLASTPSRVALMPSRRQEETAAWKIDTPDLALAPKPPWSRREEKRFWKIDVHDVAPAKEAVYQAMNRKAVASGSYGPLLFLSYTLRHYCAEAAHELLSKPVAEALLVWAEDGSMLDGILLWDGGSLVNISAYEDDLLLGQLCWHAVALAVRKYGGKSHIENLDVNEQEGSYLGWRLRHPDAAACAIRWDEAVPLETRKWQEKSGFVSASCLASDDQVVQISSW